MLVATRCDLVPPFSASNASGDKDGIAEDFAHLYGSPTLSQDAWVAARRGIAGHTIVR